MRDFIPGPTKFHRVSSNLSDASEFKMKLSDQFVCKVLV